MKKVKKKGNRKEKYSKEQGDKKMTQIQSENNKKGVIYTINNDK